ncbi:hypothetical protein SAMN02799624_05318 [Paenibacillus sp. UNC496MF]|uniref:DEAD/DEAH box helicase n=1 Tax=Paenibacillus sp. UNC496MF TaxID=1502753 RepID=UPI0008F34421|nr:DEAD/DEAH box helicase [Paenibacillus sp. UNC496MF]SFJ64065.1 hypothetical protein SAMN02799624_05318 [Paenibacillus sp. UNC496MF]
MAELIANEIYKVELFGRGVNSSAYCDLMVYDADPRKREVYLLNAINTDIKMKMLAADMDQVKTGSVKRAEGNVYDKPHVQLTIYTRNKNMFDMHESKIDDMTNMLFVAKSAKPNIKERQEWRARRDNGEQVGLPPEELVLAWDGNLRDQLYRVLDDRYNTPMLEEWKDYIVDMCLEYGYFRQLRTMSFGRHYDLEAGVLQVTEEQLEEIISEGIKSYELNFAIMEDSTVEPVLDQCETLDAYLEHFAGALGQRIQENSTLRFDPRNEDHHRALYECNLHANKNGITGLFPPQADVVMGVAKTLQEEKYCFIIGEPGSGKTVMGSTSAHVAEAIQGGKDTPAPYRALVLSPGIMVEKWMREIQERIPGAKVYQISRWTDVKKLEKAPYRPKEIEYYVMSSDASKQTYPMEAIADYRLGINREVTQNVGNNDVRDALERGEHPRIRFQKDTVYVNGSPVHRVDLGPTAMVCPRCGGPLQESKQYYAGEHFFEQKRDGKWGMAMKAENYHCNNVVETKFLPKEDIKDPKEDMQKCGFVLWQPKRLSPASLERKVSPAWYINKRLRRGFFKYLIADEVHEYKSGESDRATAFGQLVNHTEKQILLTGTLLGGMARDIFYLIARLDPRKLQKESINFNDESVFVERYGVFEHTITLRNERRNRKKKQQPGVSPQVFPRFLMSNCAFIELSDLGYALPPYREQPIFVDMDDDLHQAYHELETAVGDRMRENVFHGGMKHVATYITKMYQYVDLPFGHGPMMYDDRGTERLLHQPRNLPDDYTPPKYNALLSYLDERIDERGKKVLLYVRFTGSKNRYAADTWLYDKLKADGYNVGILRSSGQYDGHKFPKQEDREAWLRQKMEKHNWDVLICNSRLVSVGLDLLMFPCINFYQMDYSAYNYMQASRRSWRIKQTEDVEVSAMVYRETIQSDVLENIAKKIDAAMALQGKFSEEGLRAMADSGDGINALAKKLMSEGRLDDISSIEDRWKRINASYEQMQNSSYEGYDSYEMNPLGIEEVRRISAGLVSKMRDDVASGKISVEKLDSYLAHIEDMFVEFANAKETNKGLKKADRIVEGQGMLVLEF